ncbi:MAG: hypothetical protein ACRCX4_08625 [Bacteroidales bacterium]
MSNSINNRELLFVVDMQNDFCLPTGKLSVPNAMTDVERLATFIKRKGNSLDAIILTQDSHQVNDIAHACFWTDQKGESPAPFTLISSEDVKNKIWASKNPEHQEWAQYYIDALEKEGNFVHVIWPEHCITGSKGEAIVDELMSAVEEWARGGHYFELFRKGEYPYTEHFGALRANIIVESEKGTHLNQELIERLKAFDVIYVAGEAKSHCVATTLKQMLEINGLATKIVILEDCMSDVAGFEGHATPVLNDAVKQGARIAKSVEIN